jgi:hypothetical protein
VNGKLERDVLIVFGTWFMVLYLISGFPLAEFGAISTGVVLVWALGLAAGAAAAWVVGEGGMVLTRHTLASSKAPDARERSQEARARIMDADKARTLHDVPLPVIAEPEKGKVKNNLFHRLPWWTDYAARHPLHARALTDVYAVMEAKQNLPASPAGGHGGLSLIRHSMNVTASMLKMAPAWEYAGLRDRKGNVIQPLHDINAPVHRLENTTALGEPILPLLAFAHDIGKVDCYALSETGVVTEILGGHGERGAALLRKMNSVMALPAADRDALLLGVEFYHHLSNMPMSKWIPDRVRSLTALLYVADCDASAGETGNNEPLEEALERYRRNQASAAAGDPEQDRQEDSDGDVSDVASTASFATQDARPRGFVEGATPPVKTFRSPRERTRSAPSDEGHWSFEDGRTPLDVFEEVMSAPGAVNSKNKEARVAFMKDGWLYVFERNFRERAAALIPDASLLERSRGGMHAFTRDLLRMLDEKGLLLVEHGGLRYSYRRALWQATASANGSVVAIFVVKANGLPFVESLPDADHVPVIQRSMWGEVSAINKNNATGAIDGSANQEDDDGEGEFGAMETDESKDGDGGAALPILPPLPTSQEKRAGGYESIDPDPDIPPQARGMQAASTKGKALTYEVLQAFGACGAPVYGMSLKKIATGQTVASFDPDALAADYGFDLDSLPEGIQLVKGRASGKLSLVVVL